MTKPRRSNRFETIITKANVADKQRRMKERPTFCWSRGNRTQIAERRQIYSLLI